MKPNTYFIMERAVQEGALLGYRQAFKQVENATILDPQTENPSEEEIVRAITDAIMLSVSQVFTFSQQSDSYV